MLTDAQRALLARPLIARLATNGPDGTPHVVPIWFELVEGAGAVDVLFITDRGARKARNVADDGRAAVVVGGDAEDGVLLRGVAVVEDDPGQAVTHRMIERYLGDSPKAAEYRALWADDDIAVIRLRVASAVTVGG